MIIYDQYDGRHPGWYAARTSVRHRIARRNRMSYMLQGAAVYAGFMAALCTVLWWGLR